MRPTACACLLSLLGCASAPPARVPDPKATSDAFFAALCAERPAVAWALTHVELRARVDRARFEALYRENREEFRSVCEVLSRTDPVLGAHARVELEDGETVALVLEDGRWKIEGGLLDAQALATPLDTVNELRRALRRRSLSALLALLTDERRAAWTATLERTLEQTSDPLDFEVEVHGDDATVKLTGGGVIQLKREAGQWRVRDVK